MLVSSQLSFDGPLTCSILISLMVLEYENACVNLVFEL